jgi:hypothetical protein
MSKANESEEGTFPSPKGMSSWLEREITDIQKAAELRIKDATRFVNAYARGEISKDEAEEHSYAYSQRWGDVLPGVMRTGGLKDEEILKTLDEVRIKQGLLDGPVAIGHKGGTRGRSR